MSTLEKPVLVVGSGLDAHLALEMLLGLNSVGEVHHLATKRPDNEPLDFVSHSNTAQFKVALLRNVWGKTVLSLPLPALSAFRESARSHDKLVTQPPGLKVSRVAPSEESFLVTFSDGTELLCSLVLFCDGHGSCAKSFWTKLSKKSKDPNSVRCWGFRAKNYSDMSELEFRWAPAKSMEIVPESEELWVNLRFKSPFGTELSATELKSLFSEFGSDVEALFEGLADDDIVFSEEERLSSAVFLPAPGCLSLGRAALVDRRYLPFHWNERLLKQQLKILGEQLEVGKPNLGSFEAQSKEALGELEQADAFFRRHLNSDNALLRPFRNLILNVVPNSLLAGKLKQRLWLD